MAAAAAAAGDGDVITEAGAIEVPTDKEIVRAKTRFTKIQISLCDNCMTVAKKEQLLAEYKVLELWIDQAMCLRSLADGESNLNNEEIEREEMAPKKEEAPKKKAPKKKAPKRERDESDGESDGESDFEYILPRRSAPPPAKKGRKGKK